MPEPDEIEAFHNKSRADDDIVALDVEQSSGECFAAAPCLLAPWGAGQRPAAVGGEPLPVRWLRPAMRSRHASFPADDGGDDREAVFDLNVGAGSSSDSSDDSSDDGDGSDAGSDAGDDRRRGAGGRDADDSDSDSSGGSQGDKGDDHDISWGKNRRAFYDADTGHLEGDESEESDAEREEEEEAMRLQRKQLAGLEDDDFDAGLGETLGDAVEGKKGKKGKKGKARKSKASDASMLSAMTSDLAAVSSALEGSVSVERVAKDTSALSDEDKLQIVLSDSPELISLLGDFRATIVQVRSMLQPLLDRVRSGELPTSRGINYLEVKVQLLLSYVTNLAFYLLLKAEGKSVKNHPVFDQILRIRTILERCKPLDAKLQFQIEQLLRHGDAAGANGAAKPKPDALVAHDGGDGSDSDAAAADDAAFRPLKRQAVPYDDGRASAKEARELERAKRRLQNTELMKEMREEYSSRPQVMREALTGDEKLDRMDAERADWEEEHMVRLTTTKKEKKMRKAILRERERLANLGIVEDFGDVDDLIAAEADAGAAALTGAASGKRRTLQQYANEAEQRLRSQTARGLSTSGDAEVNFAERKRDAPKRARRGDDSDDGAGEYSSDDGGFQAFGRGSGGKGGAAARGGGGGLDTDDEDELVAQAKRRKRSKRAEREAAHAAAMEARAADAANSRLPDELDEAGPRKASKTILQNRGMVKYRRKDLKNPRVNQRRKFEKAAKRRKGQVREVRTGEASMYGGEASGIRSKVTRSRRIVN